VSRRYVIELSDQQAIVIQNALNLYFRIMMGQWGELGMMARFDMFAREDGTKFPMSMYEPFDKLLEAVVAVAFGFRPGQSWGILNSEIPDVARVACDIHDVIRHQRWVDEGGDEHGYSVASWEPRRLSEHEELPIIRRIEE